MQTLCIVGLEPPGLCGLDSVVGTAGLLCVFPLQYRVPAPSVGHRAVDVHKLRVRKMEGVLVDTPRVLKLLPALSCRRAKAHYVARVCRKFPAVCIAAPNISRAALAQALRELSLEAGDTQRTVTRKRHPTPTTADRCLSPPFGSIVVRSPSTPLPGHRQAGWCWWRTGGQGRVKCLRNVARAARLTA